MYRRLVLLLVTVMVVSAGVLNYHTPPALAGFSCYGRDHYHFNYRVDTKHDKRSFSNDGTVVWRKWYVKKDRNGDGNFRYDHTVLVNCGDIAKTKTLPYNLLEAETSVV